jgi:hypothetical protein
MTSLLIMQPQSGRRGKFGICDLYGPLPPCKVILEDDKRRLSCGHRCGFLGKGGDFPALMDSAHARLNRTQTSKRPWRKTGSEHAGLTLAALTAFSPSQLAASVKDRGHSGDHSSANSRGLPFMPLCETLRHRITAPRQSAHSYSRWRPRQYSSLGVARHSGSTDCARQFFVGRGGPSPAPHESRKSSDRDPLVCSCPAIAPSLRWSIGAGLILTLPPRASARRGVEI